MSGYWQGFQWIGTEAELIAANRAHAEAMADRQRRAAELQRADLVVRGRC